MLTLRGKRFDIVQEHLYLHLPVWAAIDLGQLISDRLHESDSETGLVASLLLLNRVLSPNFKCSQAQICTKLYSIEMKFAGRCMLPPKSCFGDTKSCQPQNFLLESRKGWILFKSWDMMIMSLDGVEALHWRGKTYRGWPLTLCAPTDSRIHCTRGPLHCTSGRC